MLRPTKLYALNSKCALISDMCLIARKYGILRMWKMTFLWYICWLLQYGVNLPNTYQWQKYTAWVLSPLHPPVYYAYTRLPLLPLVKFRWLFFWAPYSIFADKHTHTCIIELICMFSFHRQVIICENHENWTPRNPTTLYTVWHQKTFSGKGHTSDQKSSLAKDT